MAQQEYLHSKSYLVSAKEHLVLPIAFKSGYEATQYAKQHGLLGYNLVMKGGDIRRLLSSSGYKEAGSGEPPVTQRTDGTKTTPSVSAYKEYTPKPAWQMTREEYYKPVTLPQGWKNKGYKAIIQKAKGAIGKPTEYIVRVITPDGETLYPADHLGLTYVRAKYKEDHRMKVKDALERGLPVPPQVLVNYPDLQPRKGIKQVPMLLIARCNICNKEEVLNGQRQYDKEWAPRHRHAEKQTEIEYKIGKYFELKAHPGKHSPSVLPTIYPEQVFPLGQTVMTRGVADKVATDPAFAAFVLESLKRHASGDWGDLCEDDKKENEYALGKHLRLFSAYEKKGLPKIWIITEADRSVTTTLFPEEY